MKGKWLGFALASLMFASTAQADVTPHYLPDYVGLRGGMARTRANDARTGAAINAAGGHSLSLDTDRRSVSGQVYAGWWLHPLAALELGVGMLGDFPVTASGSTPNPERLNDDIAAHLNGAGGAVVTLVLRQQLPITERLAVVPRLGLYYARSERDIGAGADTLKHTDTRSGVLHGLGLDYALGERVHLGAGYDVFQRSSDEIQSQWGLSLEIHFGTR